MGPGIPPQGLNCLNSYNRVYKAITKYSTIIGLMYYLNLIILVLKYVQNFIKIYKTLYIHVPVACIYMHQSINQSISHPPVGRLPTVLVYATYSRGQIMKKHYEKHHLD